MNSFSKFRYWSAGTLAVLFTVGAVTLAAPDSKPAFNQAVDQTEEQGTAGEIKNTVRSETTVTVEAEPEFQARTRATISGGESDVSLTVNGQEVAVPENGSVTETVSGNSSQGSVHINVESDTSESGETDDRTRIRIRSDIDSDIDIDQSP